MKRQIFCFLLFNLILIVAGCKKKPVIVENNNGQYFVKFKANGAQQNFTIPSSTAQFHDSITVAGKKVHIYAVGAAGMNFHSIQFGIYSDKVLTGTTNYRESDLLYGYQPQMIMIYVNNPTSFGNLSIGSYDPLPPYSFPSIPRDCSISLTEVTATSIKGTFSGTVYLEKPNGEPDLNNKTSITNGEFFLPALF